MLVLGVLFDPGRTERSLSPYRMFLMLLSLAQPLACWTLLIAAIHEECLPGDRQYWLTRPFTWKSLLLEKLMFTAVFVNLARVRGAIGDAAAGGDFAIGAPAGAAVDAGLLHRNVPSRWLLLPR